MMDAHGFGMRGSCQHPQTESKWSSVLGPRNGEAHLLLPQPVPRCPGPLASLLLRKHTDSVLPMALTLAIPLLECSSSNPHKASCPHHPGLLLHTHLSPQLLGHYSTLTPLWWGGWSGQLLLKLNYPMCLLGQGLTSHSLTEGEFHPGRNCDHPLLSHVCIIMPNI